MLIRPALAALIAAGAFTPLAAQEAPPPVQSTVTAAPAPAPAPVAQPAPVFAPRAEVAQPTPPRPAPPVEAVADSEPAPRPAARTAPRARPVTRAAAPASAAAPVVVPPSQAPQAAAETPATEPATPVVAPEKQPVAATEAPASNGSSVIDWIFLAMALAVVAAMIGMIVARRRRRANAEDLAYGSYVGTDEEGVPVPEVDLDKRPWIRLALQPTGAQQRGDAREIDYEVIVENEGHVAAHDVTVSTFLTGSGATAIGGLAAGRTDTHRIDLAPGERKPLPASISVPEGLDPKIVADARYPLPDGGEGHLAARFGIDMSDELAPAEVEDVLERV